MFSIVNFKHNHDASFATVSNSQSKTSKLQ